MKGKEDITIANGFQKFLVESNRKPMCVDKGSEIYNRSMKSWLQDKDIEIYCTYNEGKSVIAERLIRPLKKKIYKYKKM